MASSQNSDRRQLVFKTKLLRFGDSLVKDADGNICFRVTDTSFFLGKTLVIQDISGKPLLSLRRRGLLSSWELHQGFATESSSKLFKVQSRWLNHGLDVYPETGCGQAIYEVESSFLGTRFTVWKHAPGDAPKLEVAKLKWETNLKSVRYYMDITPGTDPALVTALAAAINQNFHVHGFD